MIKNVDSQKKIKKMDLQEKKNVDLQKKKKNVE